MTPETTFWRQTDLLSPKDMSGVTIHLIGCGGIGSPVGIMLAKMGLPNFVLYDGDTIEEHNLPNQMYPNGQEVIGEKKTDILADLMGEFGTALRSILRNDKYDNQVLNGIVISGVDSMTTRKSVWEMVKQYKSWVNLYIDARMGAQSGLVYAIDPKNETQCGKFEKIGLYEDANAIQLPCTATAILYNTFVIAGIIGRNVRCRIKELPVPFETIVNLEHMGMEVIW